MVVHVLDLLRQLSPLLSPLALFQQWTYSGVDGYPQLLMQVIGSEGLLGEFKIVAFLYKLFSQVFLKNSDKPG